MGRANVGCLIMQQLLDRGGGSVNKIEVIRERIERVIKQEEDITQRELEKWSRKKHEEESYWGIYKICNIT